MIESLYQRSVLSKQYIAQAVDVEISITIIMKEKNLDCAFFLPFSFTMLVIILDISVQKRTNSSSSEVTLHCLFTKRSFSRVLWIGSLNMTLYYIIAFFPIFQTMYYDYSTG